MTSVNGVTSVTGVPLKTGRYPNRPLALFGANPIAQADALFPRRGGTPPDHDHRIANSPETLMPMEQRLRRPVTGKQRRSARRAVGKER